MGFSGGPAVGFRDTLGPEEDTAPAAPLGRMSVRLVAVTRPSVPCLHTRQNFPQLFVSLGALSCGFVLRGQIDEELTFQTPPHQTSRLRHTLCSEQNPLYSGSISAPGPPNPRATVQVGHSLVVKRDSLVNKISRC